MTTFPKTLDTDTNLYLVHDSLRVRLSEDYNPGDKSIHIEGDVEVINRFPPTGIITLTEQQSSIDERAISFTYSARNEFEFTGLTILPGFKDTVKPKFITNVTQNVLAVHHNAIKDALIAVEEFVGTQNTVDVKPLGETMVGRINFLRKLVLTPRAWFNANNHIGLIPLLVEFNDLSFRLGDSDVTYIWDFGDGETRTVTYTSEQLPTLPESKLYDKPGNYTVKLTVINSYGEDTVEFPNFINARIAAPQEAEILFKDFATQIDTKGDEEPYFPRLGTAPGGPYLQYPPTIRSSVDSFVDLYVPPGRRSIGDDRTFVGELLNDAGTPSAEDDTAYDPVESYTWSLGDDLTHPSINEARASYSMGGIYDVKLRVDTKFGGYRITTYKNSIDIIERRNLWLYTLSETSKAIAHEYGLISETFKAASPSRAITVTRNDAFLNGTGEEARAKREFTRNTAFAPTSSKGSGDKGEVLLMWAGGSTSMATLGSQPVYSWLYEGFSDVYRSTGLSIQRPWNWVFLDSGSKGYFVFGPDPALIPKSNYVTQRKTVINYANNPMVAEEAEPLTSANYKNAANELQMHVTAADSQTADEPSTGRFAVYRSTWKGQTGYILRNNGVGQSFRLRSFYKTEGTLTEPFLNIRKLPDMVGSTKEEGQLVTLSSGVFFFNNSGNISAYNDTSGVWEVGSSASTSFRSVQDTTADGFGNITQTLLATSDLDKVAYLSFDYSPNAFIKFSSADLTFTNLGTRPSGEQWIMGCY